LKINSYASAECRRRWWEPIGALLLIPLFSLWEGLGGFRGFMRVLRSDDKNFVVIRKPA
jgi:beta-1,4-mannosyltransferase